MKNYFIYTTIFLFLILTSCKKNDKMTMQTKKFEWLPVVSGDKICPVEIVGGSFIFSDETSVSIPNGEYLNGDWGISSGTMVVGDDFKKVPEQMEITWFSYTENKFYKGTFELPQKKIYDILRTDYGKSVMPDGSEYQNAFTRLTIGFAPQGLITVWIDGEGSKEIGTYQAIETSDVEWSNFHKGEKSLLVNSRREEMPKFVQEEISQGKISNVYFKNRLKRYQYIIGTNRNDFKIYDYDILFLNNEVISNTNTGLGFLNDTTNGKAVPINMVVFVEDQFSRQLEVRIWVDLLDGKTTYENDYLKDLEKRNFNIQLMERFKKFFAQNENVELYIKFDKEIVKSNINKPVYSGKVCLKSPTSEIEIPNSKVEVYDAE